MTSRSDHPSFEADIKPMFREIDRSSMRSRFDLWSYDDVREHADAILASVGRGSMPCDGEWPPAQVSVFRRWIEAGTPM
jgi:hypothetical protein